MKKHVEQTYRYDETPGLTVEGPSWEDIKNEVAETKGIALKNEGDSFLLKFRYPINIMKLRFQHDETGYDQASFHIREYQDQK